MLTHRELFLKHIAQTSESPLTLEVERAEGVYLFSPNGQRIFDLISGVSVSNVGHSHPNVVKAVNQQVSKYMHLMVYGELVQAPQVLLAKRIAELLPDSLQSVYFVNSGSEAVEGAIKLAKRFTGRPEIISFVNAYHGSTHGALSLMGSEGPKRAFRPLLPAVQHIKLNFYDDLNRITEKTACVIIEPIQGEAGIVAADFDYLKALRKRCTETGTLLIFDEIQTGVGRTGALFAFERYQVVPDILLVAKAFGGGMPLGAFISSSAIMHSLTNNPPLGHITTFGGHPVSCAAALAALDTMIDLKLHETVAGKEQLFIQLLKDHSQVKSIRSQGLFMAVELGSFDKVQKMIKLGLEMGFLTDWFLFCDTAFRIAPPLIITEAEIESVSSIILEALDRL
ncbi:MAG: aspartate aminotransferase family protein [Tenuifilaceae bacterium]|jgi:acetylornithine/succinyldiaminopimelate/putrescine aminotransferase|nr:aspartate aminotransferase family protein [Tenuifilaceae bacterium]